MTDGDKRERKTCESKFAIGVSVLLLAVAVFGWGLHSKLSLYHIRARASQPAPIAKLLSERERPMDSAQHCHLNHAEAYAVALAATVVLIPRPGKEVREIQPRGDAPPLPSRILVFKGPSLRRPPPLLVA
ncbi:MAG TPA: hypothetical protein VGM02_00120 [Acidobacteriaceae bacterium]|jgi:hypothetical protein